MKLSQPEMFLSALLALACSTSLPGQATAAGVKAERLGTVSFPVSCAPSQQAAFSRGVALLHNFWYEESEKQFQAIAAADPGCAMAHWGIAMSNFYQLWGRPDDAQWKTGAAEMEKASELAAPTPREREYIAALVMFFKPGPTEYPERIQAYSNAMKKLYADFPGDVDAGAFYALSIMAAQRQGDMSLDSERAAMQVLRPLYDASPDNPGVDHYIVHACDNPEMAREGLTAADHYGAIAATGPHAFHMPGHIYARLGLWQKDIDSQLGSIAAAESAEAHGSHGIMDEPHSYDFLSYAYLQSGDDAGERTAQQGLAKALTRIAEMQSMGGGHMNGMVSAYRTRVPAFAALETRDWQAAARVQPAEGAHSTTKLAADWTRAIGHGRLRQATEAQADVNAFDKTVTEMRSGKDAYFADDPAVKLSRLEMTAWVHYARGQQAAALNDMRSAADMQDKVGQGEVDIPAREMLADMLLDFGKPGEALAEYRVSLRMSPGRFNGLYNAGRAAEAAGNKADAGQYFKQLLQNTANGTRSTRPELAEAKATLAAQTAIGKRPEADSATQASNLCRQQFAVTATNGNAKPAIAHTP